MYCTEPVERALPSCEHTAQMLCGDDVSLHRCQSICNGQLLCCNNICTSRCSFCQRRSRQENQLNSRIIRTIHRPHKCGRLLFCEHTCSGSCSVDHKCVVPCLEPCRQRCAHASCNKPCSEPCIPCQEPCTWYCFLHIAPYAFIQFLLGTVSTNHAQLLVALYVLFTSLGCSTN